MKNIKCILLDIDNTLTNTNEKIPKETAEFFCKINKNYLIILVTGRTNMYAVEKSKSCNASPIVISDNGAVIYNYDKNKVLYNRFFDKDTIDTIWNISQKYNIDCVFNTLYKRYRNNKFINEEYIRNHNIGINKTDEIKNEVTQVVILSNDEEEYLKCMEEILFSNTIKMLQQSMN